MIWSRLKSLAGGDTPIAILASASTLYVPENRNAFFITGSTTIGSVVVAPNTRARRLTLTGAAGSSVTFTNNNSPTVSGQMYLRGSDLTLFEDVVLELIVKNDGTLTLAGFTG